MGSGRSQGNRVTREPHLPCTLSCMSRGASAWVPPCSPRVSILLTGLGPSGEKGQVGARGGGLMFPRFPGMLREALSPSPHRGDMELRPEGQKALHQLVEGSGD